MTEEDRIGDILLTWEDDFEQGKDVPPRSCARSAPNWRVKSPNASSP